MAITRIKNNQITDATINASTKLVDHTVTGLKLADSLVYDSDLTVTGNLVVQGVTTTIDTTNTTIEDPIMVLGAQGTVGVDIGFVGVRSAGDNIALVWDESAVEFKAVFTDSDGSDSTIDESAAGYANIRVATLTAEAISGNLALTGQTENAVVFTDATGRVTTSEDFTFTAGALDLTGSLKVDNVTINGGTVSANAPLIISVSGSDSISIQPDTGSTVVKNLQVDGHVANSVVVTNSSGHSVTSANLTFNGTSLALVGDATVSESASIADIVISEGLVAADANLAVTAVGNLVLDPTANVIVDTATAGRVFYSGTNKELIGSANFAFDGANAVITGSATVDNVTIDGDSIESAGSLTISAAEDQDVTIAVAGNGVVNVADLVFDGTTVTTTVVDGSIILDPNGNGVVSVSGAVIQNVGTPVAGTDAVNKNYVDQQVGDQSAIGADDSGIAVNDDGVAPGEVVITVDNVAVVTTTLANTVFAHPVTADDVTITGATVNADAGNLVLSSTAGTVNVAGATQYEVFVAGASGALEGSSDFTYNGANLAVTGNVAATGQVSAASLVVDNVTVDGDTITGAASTTIAATGNIVLDPTANVIVDTATATQIFYAGANRELVGSANFVYDGNGVILGGDLTVTGDVGVTGSLTVDNVTIDGSTISSDGSLTLASGNDGNINLTPNGNGVVNVANLQVAGQTPYRVVFTDVDGLMVTDGNLQFDGDDFTVTGSLTVDNVVLNGSTINTTGTNTQLRIDPNGTGDFYVDRNVTVSGNLSVLGTTTTVDSTVVRIQDPIIELGRGANGAPLTANDGKDRGVRMWYYDVTANEEQSAWMGYDHPTEEFRYFNDAVITDEEVTGVLGTINVGKVIVDTIELNDSSITAAGQLQIISGLDTDLTLTATGAGKVLIPSGDQLRVADLGENRVVFTTTGGELITDADLTFDGANLALVGKLTVDNITIDGTTVSSDAALNLTSAAGEDINITPGAGGVTNIAGLTVGGVTANRVVVSDGAGGLTSDDDFTYNSATNALVLTGSATVDNVTIDGNSVTAAGNLEAAGLNIVLNPTEDVVVSNATASHVFYAGAAKELVGSGNFTFDGANLAVTGSAAIDNVRIDSNAVSSVEALNITSGANGNINITPNGTGVVNISNLNIAGFDADRVVVTNAQGALVEVDTFTFDTATSALTLDGSATFDNVTIDGDSITGAATTSIVTATGNLVLDPAANVVVDVAAVAAGQLFVAGAAKELQTAANLAFNGTTLTVTGDATVTGTLTAGAAAIDNVVIDGDAITSSEGLAINAEDDIVIESANGAVIINDLVLAGMTGNSFVVTDANGVLQTVAALQFDGANVAITASATVTGDLTVDNVTIDGNVVSSASDLDLQAGNINLNASTGVFVSTATAQEVFYAGANGGLIGSANLTYDGTELRVAGDAEVTGTSVLGNVTVAGDDITTAGTMLTVNAAGADIDFRVSSDTKASALFVDGATGSVVLGSSTPTANVSFKVDATDAMMVPVGLTSERPSVPVAGMVRFNTNLGDLELYDGDSWNSTSAEFTLIASEVFNGDGSTTTFTLSSTQTTASCIVSINGVIQFPTLAYAVAGTSLSFTEAPLSGDVIEVRKLTTTKSFALEVVNTSETARVIASESAAQIDVTGNLVPTANEEFDLGSASFRWRDLYLSGNTIDLGGVRLKNDSGVFRILDSNNNPVSSDIDVDAGEY